ncbi:hypothetical protein KCU77_g5069, partial [Aureobasidium melanogenum]
MVTVEVGIEKEHFVVHQSFLCAKSQYFAKALSGSFQEAIARFIQLPDVSPILFKIFVAWLYHDTLVYLPSDETTIDEDFDSLRISEKDLEQQLTLQSESQNRSNSAESDTKDSEDDGTEISSGTVSSHVGHEPSSAPELVNVALLPKAESHYQGEDATTWSHDVLIKLYILADRLDIRKLRADSLDALVGVSNKDFKDWDSTIVRYIYSNTPSHAKLRRFVVHHTAYRRVFSEDPSGWNAYPLEFLVAVMIMNGRRLPSKQCGECYNKAMDFLKPHKYDDVCEQDDLAPYDRDLCFYHEHPNDEEREACRLRREGLESAAQESVHDSS